MGAISPNYDCVIESGILTYRWPITVHIKPEGISKIKTVKVLFYENRGKPLLTGKNPNAGSLVFVPQSLNKCLLLVNQLAVEHVVSQKILVRQ